MPEASLIAVADPCADRACETTASCGAGFAEQPEDVLRHPDVDAVLICSSTDTHASLLEASAAAGKHVFCEKPLDLDPARIEAALAAIERAGVLLQVGFNRRFDPGFARLAAGVRGGEIGRPEMVRITSRDPEPPPLAYVHVCSAVSWT